MEPITASEPASEPGSEQIVSGVARGSIWSVGAQVVGVLAALLLTPFTIRLLGPARYGLWSLLSSALTWVALADLGMGNASTRLAGERQARGDGDGEAIVVWTAAAITVACTSAAAGIVIALAPQIVGSLLHIRGHLLGPGILAFRIAAAASILAVISGTLNTSLVIRQRWATYTVIASGSSILQIALLPPILLVAGRSVVTATSVALGCTLLQAIGIVFCALRLQPLLRRVRVSREVGRSLLGFGGALTIAGIASIALTSAERLLLGHNRSAVVVAYYAVASRLATQITLIPTAITQPIYPALVTLHGRDEAEAGRRLYRQSLQGLFLVMTPAVCALAFIAHPFLTLWAGSVYGRHSLVPFFVLLAGVWFNAIAWLPATYLTAASRPRIIAIIHVCEVAPYIVAAALLTARFGALGAAIVWTARVVIDALIFSVVAHRTLGAAISPLSSRLWRSLIAPCLLGATMLVLSSVIVTLPERLGGTLVLMTVYGWATWRLVLTASERSGLTALALTATPIGRLLPAHARP